MNVLGQVFAPGGGPITQPVRVNFTSDSGLRPPDILFTDSNGRFVIYGLVQGENYTVLVDANEPNWGQTIVRFTPLGRRPTVEVYLNLYSRPRARNTSPSVSASALRTDIPGKARRAFDAGMSEAVKGNYGKAQEKFEKALVIHPAFVEARNELAVTLMKEGNLPGAEKQLRTALATDPAAVMPLMNLGLCIYRQQRYDDASVPLERAVQLDPENYRAHMLLGMVWVMAGDDPRAEATLLRAYQLGGARAARAQFYLSHFYTRKKHYPQAARALETYLRDVPTDANAAELSKTLEKLRTTIAKK